MRPKLKISNLTNLQDARSSAAVGFDLISFCLERGSNKKLSPEMIGNIANWLSGPEIILEMNVVSLGELSLIDKTFSWRYITLPFSEWNDDLLNLSGAVILRADETCNSEVIRSLVQQAGFREKELKFEINLPHAEAAKNYISVAEHIFLHFPDITQTLACVQSEAILPFGFSLGEEAEEEPGMLNYQLLDEFLEIFSLHFPEPDSQ
ncbi:MAG: hypothetical protein SF052_27780 [Bacteroidia bacterium]|nr:hypothetical protein [Bacteroidia bacterium]